MTADPTGTRGVGIDPAVDAARPLILQRLAQLERERGLRVVYACESGSRAWGFASTDSDFDVRFIYVQCPETYLQLRPHKDAFDVQFEGDLDLGGWDIRKTAELMRKSNPPLLEWLDSPIVYLADGDISDELIRLRSAYFCPKKTAYHYLSLANNVFKTYLDDQQPKRKKYLYAIRPLACIRYIDLYRTQPPTAMLEVIKKIDWPLDSMKAVDTLVREKMTGGELGRAPRDPLLDSLIKEGLEQAERTAELLPTNDTKHQPLDQMICRAILGNVEG